MAQFKIKLGELTISRRFEADISQIKGNFTQLQEAFFNMIDNAYDAMMQRKNEMKPSPNVIIQLGEATAKTAAQLFVPRIWERHKKQCNHYKDEWVQRPYNLANPRKVRSIQKSGVILIIDYAKLIVLTIKYKNDF